MDVSVDLAMLQEYNQWVTTQRSKSADVSPEEFMRDRIKEVAYDRLDAALNYINNESQHSMKGRNAHPIDMITVKQILEGTYVKPEAEADDGTEGGAVAEPEPVETNRVPKPNGGGWAAV